MQKHKKPHKWTDAESYFAQAKEIHQERLMMVHRFIKHVVLPVGSTPIRDKMFGREVANMIFDLPSIYSGKASALALIQKRMYNVEWVAEHEWPRQLTGEFLIRACRKYGDVELPWLREFLFEFMHVNRTTRAENEMLKAYYKDTRALESPQEAYTTVGINLLDWPKGVQIRTLEDRHPHLKSIIQKGQIILSNSALTALS